MRVILASSLGMSNTDTIVIISFWCLFCTFKMKKQKLFVDYEFDFDVFGVVSAFKDYKLAWNLNKSLGISLTRKKDLLIKFVDHTLAITNFKFKTENSLIRLLKNRSYESQYGENLFLVPEMITMDFFIMVTGDTGYLKRESASFLDILRKVNGVDYAIKVEIEKIKSKENFLF